MSTIMLEDNFLLHYFCKKNCTKKNVSYFSIEYKNKSYFFVINFDFFYEFSVHRNFKNGDRYSKCIIFRILRINSGELDTVNV